MIAIYFRPDFTQIVQGTLHKNFTFHIEDYMETDAALSFIVNDGMREKENLSHFFKQLKNDTDAANEDVYVVLPDCIFSFVDSVEYINETNLRSMLQEHTGVNAENLYVVRPVVTSSPAPNRQSVYAILKKYVDKLVEVSMKERIALTSVEPASLAFFRAYGDWHNEMPLVEMFPDEAAIITYSPAGGIFLTDSPSISEKALLQAGVEANSAVSAVFAANDFTASQTFMNMNTDMPYFVLTDNRNIQKLQSIALRAPEAPLSLPDFIVAKNLERNQHARWMPAIGTLLQVYDELPDKASLENPLYEKKDAFVTVKSGNLLPESAKQAARNRQWKRVIRRGCQYLCIGFAVLLVIETAALIFFSSYSINPALKADYEKALADIAQIEKEVKIIDIAHRENQDAVEAYQAIAHARPDGVGFTDIKIGQIKPVSSSGKKKAENNTPYITLTAVSGNAMLFQDLRGKLESEDLFDSPAINSITQNGTTGFQTAQFTIMKGSSK